MLLKHKVLIAEDDEAIVELVFTTLEGAGYQCLHAENGARALDMMRLYAPGLLVLDVMMPQMDGIETAQRMRKDELLTEIPILMLTALSEVENKVSGLGAGADAYIPKPFDVRELLAQISALLRAKKRGLPRHPVTDLPGPGAVMESVARSLSTDEPTAVVHFTVREFHAYAAQVGFAQAAAFITSLGDMLQDQMRDHFLFTSSLGHLSGDEFVVVLPRESAESLMRDVIASFQTAHGSWISSDAPIRSMSMVAASASTEGLGDNDIEALAERLASAMKDALAEPGPRYVRWTPDQG